MVSSDSRFDKRIIERALRSGSIKPEEFERYLTKLKDLGNEAEACESELLHIARRIPSKVLGEDDEL